MPELTEKDLLSASNSLIDWFKSQDLSPSSGTLVMIRVIAGQLVEKDKNILSLHNSINLISQLLTIEVVDLLRRRI